MTVAKNIEVGVQTICSSVAGNIAMPTDAAAKHGSVAIYFNRILLRSGERSGADNFRLQPLHSARTWESRRG
jgi:hypothetical protein